jgi:hypothetical protein
MEPKRKYSRRPNGRTLEIRTTFRRFGKQFGRTQQLCRINDGCKFIIIIWWGQEKEIVVESDTI